MESNRIKIKPLLIFITAFMLAEAVLNYIVLTKPYNPLLVTGAVRLFETLIMFLIAFLWGGGLLSFGLSHCTILPGLKKGLIGSAAFGIVTMLFFTALYATGNNPLLWLRADLPSRHGELIIFFIVGTVVSPLAEEVFFRGVLYGFFRKWGAAVAVVLSTLLFVFAHPAGSAIPWSQIIGGILFASAYEMTGNLVVPITIHILGNLAIFSLPLISKWVL